MNISFKLSGLILLGFSVLANAERYYTSSSGGLVIKEVPRQGAFSHSSTQITEGPKSGRKVVEEVPTKEEVRIQENTLPAAIENSEILKELYKEYISNIQRPNALKLAPDEERGFMCHIYSIETGQMVQWKVSFKTAENGRGRFLTFRMEEPGKAEARTYTLLRKEKSWRGESNAPSESIRLLPEFLSSKEIGRSNSRPSDSGGGHDGYFTDVSWNTGPTQYSLDNPWVSANAFRFETVSISENSNDPDELFIELGAKSTVVPLDINNKPMLTGPFKVESYNSYSREERSRKWGDKSYSSPKSNLTQTVYKDAQDLKKTFLPQMFGNKDLPPSFAFKDIAQQGVAQNGDWYRALSIGVCGRIESEESNE